MKDQQEVLNLGGASIAMALVAILAYLCWTLATQEIPASNENILFAVVGVVATQITQIVSFFFGSSQSSKKQSETIDKLAQTTHQAQSAALPSDKATVTLAPGASATVEASDGGHP